MGVITIERGGESIYVTPFAYSDSADHPSKNKVHYYQSPEFSPYGNDFILGNSFSGEYLLGWDSFHTRRNALKRFWYMYPGRLLNAIKAGIKLASRSKIKNIAWITKTLLRTNIPFVATEVYDYKFSIPHHMMIVEESPGEYTDDYYLTPSQRFLEVELENLLAEYVKIQPIIAENYELANKENAHAYLYWRVQMRHKGLKIGFIASLDT